MKRERAGATLERVCGLLEQLRGDPRGDAELLARFAAGGDEGAFRELLRRHGRLVWGVCRRVLPREHDAEDAFQAAFLVLARKAGSVLKQQSVGSWLYGVAYNASLQLRRRQTRQRARDLRAAREARDMDIAEKADPLERVENEEALALLDEELRLLPDKYQVPVLLCDLGGHSNADAARQLGLPVGTLKTRL